MTEEQRKNTIKNTGNMLRFVKYPIIQVSQYAIRIHVGISLADE
jgi:hypothetical protein